MSIVQKNGRARSHRELGDYESALKKELARLSPDELETFRLMLDELKAGPQIQPGTRIIDALGSSEFERTPVDIETFIMDPYFLGHTCSQLYPRLLEDMKELFEGGYTEAILTGSIGWGKTFFASIGICRVIYELSCMKDPQRSFGIASGSTLSITNMSVNELLARKVVFDNIAGKIKPSKYFEKEFPFEPTQKEMRFPKNIWLVARATTDTSVLGLNTIAAVVDETNFMYRPPSKVLNDKRFSFVSQAETIYASIKRRMKSRFESGGRLPGMLFIVSSKNTADDFTAKRIQEATNDPTVFVRDYALWDVKPDGHYSSSKFSVLCGNEQTPSKILESSEVEEVKQDRIEDGCVIIEVPEDFHADFEMDLEGAIRDIAGIATVAVNPYIQRRDKIHAAIVKERRHPYSSLVCDPSRYGTFLWDEMVFEAPASLHGGEKVSKPRINPQATRNLHIDPSLRGDFTGLCMAHVGGTKQVRRKTEDGRIFIEIAPIYIVDVILQIVPPVGGEIVLGDIRHLIYDFSAHGYSIRQVSLDSWQSVDTVQQLKAKGYRAEVVSVDTTTEPYDNLKTALYEDRVYYYAYPPLLRELEHLQEDRRGNRRKIDHPVGGSKDCADALAGCLFTLSRRASVQPLPFIQGSAYAQDPWMPEQYQAALAGHVSALQQEFLGPLPPFLTGEGSEIKRK